MSEWAARCPECRASLDGASPIPVAEAPADPAPAATAVPFAAAATRWLMRRRRLVAVGVAVALAALVAATTILPGGSGRRFSVDGLPTGLDSERLVAIGSGRVGFYSADGKVISAFPAAVANDSNPVDVGHGTVFFVAGSSAFRASLGLGAKPVRVGQASSVFPGPDHTAGLQQTTPNGPSDIRLLDPDGRLTTSTSVPGQLPPVTQAVAWVTSGLLAETPTGAYLDPRVRISLYQGVTARTVATASAIVAVQGDRIATANCPPYSDSCSLATIDLADHRVERLQPPRGFGGYAPVAGALSPNGRLLGAFVAVVDGSGDIDLRACVVNLDTGVATVSGPAIALFDQFTQMAWSRDGRWLFYSVSGGFLYGQQTSGVGPVGQSWPLPLPATSQAVSL